MGNGNGNKLGNGLSGRSALIVAVASAIFGSISGPVLLVKFGGDSVVAPDRFTGAQGAALEARIEKCEAHLTDHPDQTNRFDARLAVVEALYPVILANQERIIKRLDGLSDR